MAKTTGITPKQVYVKEAWKILDLLDKGHDDNRKIILNLIEVLVTKGIIDEKDVKRTLSK